MTHMASPSCSISALLDSDYLGQVEVESLKNCTRDISRHRQLHGLSGEYIDLGQPKSGAPLFFWNVVTNENDPTY